MDDIVKEAIAKVEASAFERYEPVIITGLNPFQRKQAQRILEKAKEYQIKGYREDEEMILKVTRSVVSAAWPNRWPGK
ncbi:MAG: hypothetical protein MZU84_02275 [Sphingobacterium sp.]|nr:hypothetical protein [Sphingobacterium sp.]